MPSAPNVAVVTAAFGFANVTVPPAESSRPLILLHVVVRPGPGQAVVARDAVQCGPGGK